MLIAIRNGAGKGIHTYTTKKERSKILSNFPNASVRLFENNQLKLAEDWIQNKKITPAVVPTKVPEISTKEHVKIPEKNEKIVPINTEQEETDTSEFSNESFLSLLNIYKEKGISAVNLALENGSKITLMFKDIYYLKQNTINFLPIETPRTTMNIQPLKFKNKNETADKSKIFSFNNVKAEIDELLSCIPSISLEELFDLMQNKENFIGVLPKIDYQLIGNFLFLNQAGEIVLETNSIGLWDEFSNNYIFDNTIGENITINVNSIKKIIPYEMELEVKDVDWKNYFNNLNFNKIKKGWK